MIALHPVSWFDERVKTEPMSYCFKTEHYEMVLKAGDMERVMPKMAHHLEEPRVGQAIQIITQLNLRANCKGVKWRRWRRTFCWLSWRYYRAVVNNNFEDYINKYYLYWQRLASNRDLKKMFDQSGKT